MRNLIVLRKLKKQTQKDMADMLGISRTAYCSYENDVNEPSIDVINRLADFFDVSIDYLLGREEEQQIFDNARIEITPLQKTEIQKLFDNMNELQQIEIVSYARGMLARGASLRNDSRQVSDQYSNDWIDRNKA